MLFLLKRMSKLTLKSVYKTLLGVVCLVILGKIYKKMRYGGM
jgi:hypothetical protein